MFFSRTLRGYIELAERLSELVPISGAPKATFNSDEAVENAIRFQIFSKRTGPKVF